MLTGVLRDAAGRRSHARALARLGAGARRRPAPRRGGRERRRERRPPARAARPQPAARVAARPLRATRSRATTSTSRRAAQVEQAALNAVAARDRELLQELLQALRALATRRRRTASRRSTSTTSSFAPATCCATTRTIRDARAAALPPGLRRRVPGHEPAPVRADRPRSPGTELFFVGDEFQSIYRFRHADVEVFKERREQVGEVLPLTQNWRSRPEVLEVVNHLFARDLRGRVPAARRRWALPRPGVRARRSSCSSPTRRATRAPASRGAAARRRRSRAGCSELVDDGRGRAGRDRAAVRRRHRRRAVRGGAARGRTCRPTARPGAATSASSRSSTCSATCACCTTATTTRRSSPCSRRRSSASRTTRSSLLRRAAPRRPLFTGLERGLPDGLAERDVRLFQAFRQRYDRLAAIAGTVGLERLCEQIVVEHDYDLAVLAQWDGRRRYANLRKLARLARSYEELRGPDVEGFVRFVLEQDAAGVKELEAVAEEEGAGRGPAADDPRREGARVQGRRRRRRRPRAAAGRAARRSSACPTGASASRSSTRRRASASRHSSTTRCARPRSAAEEAERLRLYYVAMTRAIDKLIVAGSVDSEKPDPRTPIGWVLERLELGELEDGEVVRDEARLALQVDRFAARGRGRRGAAARRSASCRCSTRPRRPPEPVVAGAPAARADRRAAASACGASPTARSRCSSAARTASTRSVSPGCGRWTARQAATDRRRSLAGSPRPRSATRCTACSSASTSPRRRRRRSTRCSRWYPAATGDELGRIGGLVEAFCGSTLAARLAALDGVSSERPFAFEHDGVLFHGVLDVFHLDGGRALVADFKSNVLGEQTPAEIVDAEYRLQRLVYALACFRAGAEEVEVVYQFLERPGRARRGDLPPRQAARSSRPSCPRRSPASRRGGSRRGRASSRARAARRSTWSAPARICAELPRCTRLGSRRGTELRRRGSSSRRAEEGAHPADRRAADAPSTPMRASRCGSARTSSCSSR